MPSPAGIDIPSDAAPARTDRPRRRRRIAVATIAAVSLAAGTGWYVHDQEQRSRGREIVAEHQAAIDDATREFDTSDSTAEKFAIWSRVKAQRDRSHEEQNRYARGDEDLATAFERAFAHYQQAFDGHYSSVYASEVEPAYPADGDTDYRAQIVALTRALETLDAIAAEQDANRETLDLDALDVDAAFVEAERGSLRDALDAATAALQSSIDAAVARYDDVIAASTVDGADAGAYRSAVTALEGLKGTLSADAYLVGESIIGEYTAEADALISAYSAAARELDAAAAAAAQARSSASAGKSAAPGRTSSTGSSGSSTSSGSGSGGAKWVQGSDGKLYDAAPYCGEWLECTSG